ncbi:helicase, putative [Entamoeba histolytica HM-1:IMSS-B]|uniref:Helicase, putative n=6 Tax=Entamoeba histolytica TaxID=5759 RepID=C4M518_ENTH1|nr:helicase, putative [Entamoeba histolytica HM-1:IMSS]EMD43120.1 helicase, putative [Entamoeba histolytica KU27]EMH77870.1 helicase, putative [Entamoeba histolytica HM-1:IMSS-B]EMS17743.1 helicase, putative [Entamoeba histolytica HM-3:IMSS]ENY60403.1 helicase, putative [Entamoeba histolytica HM-1:IMSS-A]GAT96491.1 helicase putative [Entamoeba histolytica]|eukprot:XP_654593.2 helicase, putative [Entamoeba histolytica HM-1:IMSS]
MEGKKKFFRKPLTSAQINVLKKQEEPACDLVLEIMSKTEFGCHQRKLPKEIVKAMEGMRGFHKDNGFFLPLRHYHNIVSQLKNMGFSMKEIPNEVLQYFQDEIEGIDTSPQEVVDMSRIGEQLLFKLKPFQVQGVEFGIRHNGRCLIADEMGLGKTLQAISIAQYYKTDWPLLVICPSSLRTNWKNEIVTNCKCYDDVVVMFSSKDLNKPWGKVTIVSYEIAAKHAQEILDKQFKIVIADECHYLKNSQSKRCRELLPVLVNAEHTILLSGTALLSRPSELYPQMQALRFPIFSSFHNFGIRYCNAKVTQFGWDYTGNSHLPELHILLSKFVMIRRLKEEVLSELPDKERMEVVIDISQEDIIKMKDLRLAAEIQKKKLGDKVEKFTKQIQFVELYNMTCTAKLKGVCSFLDKMIIEGKKLLVFGHHQEMLDGIETYIKENNIEYIRIDGSTNASLRAKYVDRFQKEKRIRIAILSVTAAGTGITLHSADTVVFAELYWTPGVLRQAEDRVHRIGQKNDVRIFYLIGKQTVDDLIWPLLEKKLKISGETLDGKEVGHDTKKVTVSVEIEKEDNNDNIGSKNTPITIDCDDDIFIDDDNLQTTKPIDYDNSSELLEDVLFEEKPRRKTKTIITEVNNEEKKKSVTKRISQESDVSITGIKEGNNYGFPCLIGSRKLKEDNGKPIALMKPEPMGKRNKTINDFFKVTKPIPKGLLTFANEVDYGKKKKIDEENSLLDDIPSSVFTSCTEVNEKSQEKEIIQSVMNNVSQVSVKRMPSSVNFFSFNSTCKNENKKDILLEEADKTIQKNEEEIKKIEVIEIEDDKKPKHSQELIEAQKLNETMKQPINTKKKGIVIKLTKHQKEVFDTKMGGFNKKNKERKRSLSPSQSSITSFFKTSDEIQKKESKPEKTSLLVTTTKKNNVTTEDEFELEPNEFEKSMIGLGNTTGKMKYHALLPNK